MESEVKDSILPRSLIGVRKEIPVDLTYLFALGSGSCWPTVSLVDENGNPAPSHITLDVSVHGSEKIIISASMKNSDYFQLDPAKTDVGGYNDLYKIKYTSSLHSVEARLQIYEVLNCGIDNVALGVST